MREWAGLKLAGAGLFDVSLLLFGLSFIPLVRDGLLTGLSFIPLESTLIGIGLFGMGLFEESLLLIGLSLLLLDNRLSGIGLVDSGLVGIGLAAAYLFPFGLSLFFLKASRDRFGLPAFGLLEECLLILPGLSFLLEITLVWIGLAGIGLVGKGWTLSGLAGSGLLTEYILLPGLFFLRLESNPGGIGLVEVGLGGAGLPG